MADRSLPLPLARPASRLSVLTSPRIPPSVLPQTSPWQTNRTTGQSSSRIASCSRYSICCSNKSNSNIMSDAERGSWRGTSAGVRSRPFGGLSSHWTRSVWLALLSVVLLAALVTPSGANGRELPKRNASANRSSSSSSSSSRSPRRASLPRHFIGTSSPLLLSSSSSSSSSLASHHHGPDTGGGSGGGSKHTLGRSSKTISHHPKEVVIEKASHLELSFLLGHKIVLVCVARGIPRPKITWLKEGVEIAGHPYVQISEWLRGDNRIKSKLEIDPARPMDSGSYECQADNKFAADRRMFRAEHFDDVPR